MRIPKYSCGTDDISFCMDACDNIKCYRNPINIINYDIPHSFSYFKGTKFCHLEDEDA